MKVRYVVGCTFITLFSVMALANYYYETAPDAAKGQIAQIDQSKSIDAQSLPRKATIGSADKTPITAITPAAQDTASNPVQPPIKKDSQFIFISS